MIAKSEIPIRVECYAGHKGEQTPRRFELGGGIVDVAEVPDAWLSPDRGHFKVRGFDGATYILRHGRDPAAWTLERYEAPPRTPILP